MAGAKLAFLLQREALDQPLGNQQPQDAVADELQPLVGPDAAPVAVAQRAGAAMGGGAVGQRFLQQGGLGEAVT